MSTRILVVDDSVQLRRSVCQALERLPGVLCVEAEDGAEALKRLHADRFDLVLTDINMPVLDGLKLVAHIRGDPRRAGLPIVVITTEASDADRERAMRLGASAYLVKPVQAQTVRDTVQRLLATADA
jgi:two-component system chemotaxis response regulator CheY